MASTGTKKSKSKKIWWIAGGVLGFFVLLFILAAIFGSPSADKVFKDMSEEMLKTKSVTATQDYKIISSDGSNVSYKSKAYINLLSNKDLLAKGNFSINATNSDTPMTVEGDFVKYGDSKYVRYTKMSSTSPQLSSSFSSMDTKLNSKWIKVRDGDQLISFSKLPFESITNLLPMPTPFANLNDTQRKNVLAILQDKSMYTVEESSKVDIGDISAYKYSIKYDKNQYNKVVKAISGYVSYFKTSGSDDSDIKSLTVWVNASTSQIVKIEIKSTSKDGNQEGTITFTDYNQNLPIEKPSDYSIESELLN